MLCLKNTGVQALSCMALLMALTSNAQPVSAAPVEICDDGFDNDKDGATDCGDGACALNSECQEAAKAKAATITPATPTGATEVICANGGLDECMRGCDSPYCRAWFDAEKRGAARYVAKEKAEAARIAAKEKAEASSLKAAAKSVKSLCSAKIYDEVECESAEDWDKLKSDVLGMAKVKFAKNQETLANLAFDADGSESVPAMDSESFVKRWLPRLGGWGAPRPVAKPQTSTTTTSAAPAPTLYGFPPANADQVAKMAGSPPATTPPCDEQEVDCKAVRTAVWPGRDCTKPLNVKVVRPEEWSVCKDMVETYRGGYCSEGGGL